MSSKDAKLTSNERVLKALREARLKVEAAERRWREPIAIIGMGCRFPGGIDGPEAYWRLLREGVDPTTVESKLQLLIDRYYAPEVARTLNYVLYPLSRVYLHMTPDYGLGYSYEPWGNIDQVRLFSAIALLILVISCINFTNLSIARSTGRAREVGLRKVTGPFQANWQLSFCASRH